MNKIIYDHKKQSTSIYRRVKESVKSAISQNEHTVNGIKIGMMDSQVSQKDEKNKSILKKAAIFQNIETEKDERFIGPQVQTLKCKSKNKSEFRCLKNRSQKFFRNKTKGNDKASFHLSEINILEQNKQLQLLQDNADLIDRSFILMGNLSQTVDALRSKEKILPQQGFSQTLKNTQRAEFARSESKNRKTIYFRKKTKCKEGLLSKFKHINRQSGSENIELSVGKMSISAREQLSIRINRATSSHSKIVYSTTGRHNCESARNHTSKASPSGCKINFCKKQYQITPWE